MSPAHLLASLAELSVQGSSASLSQIGHARPCRKSATRQGAGCARRKTHRQGTCSRRAGRSVVGHSAAELLLFPGHSGLLCTSRKHPLSRRGQNRPALRSVPQGRYPSNRRSDPRRHHPFRLSREIVL